MYGCFSDGRTLFLGELRPEVSKSPETWCKKSRIFSRQLQIYNQWCVVAASSLGRGRRVRAVLSRSSHWTPTGQQGLLCWAAGIGGGSPDFSISLAQSRIATPNVVTFVELALLIQTVCRTACHLCGPRSSERFAHPEFDHFLRWIRSDGQVEEADESWRPERYSRSSHSGHAL